MKEDNFGTPNGLAMRVVGSSRIAGAWLSLLGGRSLTVQDSKDGTYAGYRDGKTQADTLAISDVDGKVGIQVILPGDGDEASRIRCVSIERLYELVTSG